MHVTTRYALIWLLFAAFLGVQALTGTQALGIADVSEVEFERADVTDGDDGAAGAPPVFAAGVRRALRASAAYLPTVSVAPPADPAVLSPWAAGPPA